MCVKCLRYSRNHPAKTISNGHAKFLAHRFIKGHSIPVFRERAANLTIEAWVYRIEQARSRRKKEAPDND